jgi:hypothetical protein
LWKGSLLLESGAAFKQASYTASRIAHRASRIVRSAMS